MTIRSDKWESLKAKMLAFGIREEDLVEEFIRARGRGGQKVNKTSSCVYLMHTPTGLFVKCQKDRLQSVNRFWARRLLLKKIEQHIKGQASEQAQKAHKIRKQKQKRSKRTKEKLLEMKRKRSILKQSRQSVAKDIEE